MPEPSGAKESRPATAGDLRGLRRWLLVAGVWAIAATAIAVIALIAATKDDSAEQNRRSARIADRIDRMRGALDDRIDELDARLEGLPVAEDVSDLDNRLRRVEGGAGRTSDQIEQLTGDVDDLRQQIDSLDRAGARTNAGSP